MSDSESGRLPAPVHDPSQKRMLKRGMRYLDLVEPLEAGIYKYMGGHHASPYISRIHSLPAANVVAINPPPPYMFLARRPEFTWLEDAISLRNTGKKLWKSGPGTMLQIDGNVWNQLDNNVRATMQCHYAKVAGACIVQQAGVTCC